ncbi:MAG: hypothetical protein ACYDH3_13000 [Candidatus Aminicenantales bacterium]
MISKEDDEPEDPRRYRRSLVPLDIEDAEKNPSFIKRVAGFFRKKRTSEPDETESPRNEPGSDSPGGPPEGIIPPEGSMPERLDSASDDGDFGQYL